MTFHSKDISHPGHFTAKTFQPLRPHPKTLHSKKIPHPKHFTSRTFHPKNISSHQQLVCLIFLKEMGSLRYFKLMKTYKFK